VSFWAAVKKTDSYVLLRSWNAGTGPIKDAYNIGENPQFRMEMKPGATGVVWILLTRHITQIEDFKENREFITVLVYKNDGRRVYYPSTYTISMVDANMMNKQLHKMD
jgi:calpain-7